MMIRATTAAAVYGVFYVFAHKMLPEMYAAAGAVSVITLLQEYTCSHDAFAVHSAELLLLMLLLLILLLLLLCCFCCVRVYGK